MRTAKVLTLLLAAALALTPAITASAKYDAEIDAPDDVKEICEKYGAEYDICPELLEAICWNESRYTVKITAGTCKGIMQIYGKGGKHPHGCHPCDKHRGARADG